MQVSRISDEEVFRKAEEFLKKHHPDLTLPIPVEQIAETKLGLMILPVKHLEALCEISGSMSRDFKTILIDERTYDTQEDRARFTIAHEIGHYVLHKKIFEEANGSYSKEDFIQFQNELDNNSYRNLETQAYRFAEGILYPREKLRLVVTQIVEELGGLEALTITDLEKISQVVSSKFGVSERAAFNRVKREYPIIISSATSSLPL
jgi:Zn-dependent peptidase ImmA (M78 family)